MKVTPQLRERLKVPERFSSHPTQDSPAEGDIASMNGAPYAVPLSHQGETSTRRPKLLFLARAFPPLRVTACVRTWNLAKYLARLGWDITVVTPHPSVWRHVDSPEEIDAQLDREGIKRLLTGHRWRCLLSNSAGYWNHGPGWLLGGVCRTVARHLAIDNGVGWVQAAKRVCSTLTADDADVILATGSPFAAFRLAKRLSDKLGRPYVLDYRDPWTGNPHIDRPARSSVMRQEERLLHDSAAVTIVSPSWAGALDDRFHLGAKLHVVTNGYDPEELAHIKPHAFGHFAIVYAGNFYPPKRTIAPVMAALKRLKDIENSRRSEWYFHYYGRDEHHIHEEGRRSGVLDRIVLHGQVPRAEALSAVRGANIAVVITSVAEETTMEDRGIVPGKVFETLGLGSPTLLIAPPNSDVATIAEGTGIARQFTGSDTSGMVSFLSDALRDPLIRSDDHEMYAWTRIAQEMDIILRAALGAALRHRHSS